MQEPKERRIRNDILKTLPDMLYPACCEAIDCPLLKKEKCGICSLDKIIRDAAGGEETDGIRYDPSAVPCPLGELESLTYKNWLDMPRLDFKKKADAAINLLAEQYRLGCMELPAVSIISVAPDGTADYTVSRHTVQTDYGRVAHKIYDRMGTLIPQAQLSQRRFTDERTSVTMTITYLPEAKIAFLKEIEALCKERYTDKDIKNEVKRLAERWIEEHKEEGPDTEGDIEQLDLLIEEQCREINERYGTSFSHDRQGRCICFSHKSRNEEAEYERRLSDISARLEKIRNADWILIKSYAGREGVLGMCSAFRQFKKKYEVFWKNINISPAKTPGRIRSSEELIACIPALYNDFVWTADHYAEVLDEEEKRRMKQYKNPKPIMNRKRERVVSDGAD